MLQFYTPEKKRFSDYFGGGVKKCKIGDKWSKVLFAVIWLPQGQLCAKTRYSLTNTSTIAHLPSSTRGSLTEVGSKSPERISGI